MIHFAVAFPAFRTFAFMTAYTDQLGTTILLQGIPERIVSLVPSQTELLADLGLEEEVVGITKFCIHPEHWFKTKTRIGGTKKINIEKIIELKPDLVIANKEENERGHVEELSKYCPVWTSNINTLDDAVHMIRSIGAITGKKNKAAELARNILHAFESNAILPVKKAAYLIWKDPFMTVGSDSFIHDLLYRAGFKNVFGDAARYPLVEAHDICKRAPDVLLLSSEPFPFNEQHIAELQDQFPGIPIQLVDGEMFSWYGSRLLQAPSYFRRLQTEMTSIT